MIRQMVTVGFDSSAVGQVTHGLSFAARRLGQNPDDYRNQALQHAQNTDARGGSGITTTLMSSAYLDSVFANTGLDKTVGGRDGVKQAARGAFEWLDSSINNGNVHNMNSIGISSESQRIFGADAFARKSFAEDNEELIQGLINKGATPGKARSDAWSLAGKKAHKQYMREGIKDFEESVEEIGLGDTLLGIEFNAVKNYNGPNAKLVQDRNLHVMKELTRVTAGHYAEIKGNRAITEDRMNTINTIQEKGFGFNVNNPMDQRTSAAVAQYNKMRDNGGLDKHDRVEDADSVAGQAKIIRDNETVMAEVLKFGRKGKKTWYGGIADAVTGYLNPIGYAVDKVRDTSSEVDASTGQTALSKLIDGKNQRLRYNDQNQKQLHAQLEILEEGTKDGSIDFSKTGSATYGERRYKGNSASAIKDNKQMPPLVRRLQNQAVADLGTGSDAPGANAALSMYKSGAMQEDNQNILSREVEKDIDAFQSGKISEKEFRDKTKDRRDATNKEMNAVLKAIESKTPAQEIEKIQTHLTKGIFSSREIDKASMDGDASLQRTKVKQQRLVENSAGEAAMERVIAAGQSGQPGKDGQAKWSNWENYSSGAESTPDHFGVVLKSKLVDITPKDKIGTPPDLKPGHVGVALITATEKDREMAMVKGAMSVNKEYEPGDVSELMEKDKGITARMMSDARTEDESETFSNKNLKPGEDKFVTIDNKKVSYTDTVSEKKEKSIFDTGITVEKDPESGRDVISFESTKKLALEATSGGKDPATGKEIISFAPAAPDTKGTDKVVDEVSAEKGNREKMEKAKAYMLDISKTSTASGLVKQVGDVVGLDLGDITRDKRDEVKDLLKDHKLTKSYVDHYKLTGESAISTAEKMQTSHAEIIDKMGDTGILGGSRSRDKFESVVAFKDKYQLKEQSSADPGLKSAMSGYMKLSKDDQSDVWKLSQGALKRREAMTGHSETQKDILMANEADPNMDPAKAKMVEEFHTTMAMKKSPSSEAFTEMIGDVNGSKELKRALGKAWDTRLDTPQKSAAAQGLFGILTAKDKDNDGKIGMTEASIKATIIDKKGKLRPDDAIKGAVARATRAAFDFDTRDMTKEQRAQRAKEISGGELGRGVQVMAGQGEKSLSALSGAVNGGAVAENTLLSVVQEIKTLIQGAIGIKTTPVNPAKAGDV